MSIEDGIRNYQYLDRLAAMYQDAGIELHRRQPGFLTGTNIPPSIAIIMAVLDLLLAAGQGVRNYGLEMGQTMHLVQDAAAVRACRDLCQEYLAIKGYHDVFTPITLLHWMGAWPQDEAQAAALVAYGGTLARVSGATSVTTKTVHEAFGIPTPEANAHGLRMTRMAIYLARDIRLDSMREFQDEVNLIKREVRPILDKVLNMGDGDVATGTVRAFEAGVLDVPWSPNRWVKSRIMPARDVDGYLRIFDPGLMPFSPDVLEFHRERLRMRASREGVAFDVNLAITSVYEMSEATQVLMPDDWAARAQPM
jgi:methylaspartate mutase epsilon subunit